MSGILLTVVLPGLNEFDALPLAIERYGDALARCGVDDYELIIVDDGSTDGMGELADRIAGERPKVRVLHQKNQGQVASILRGFASARGRILTHNGMDLPFDPGDTAVAVECVRKGADVVVVQRKTRESYGYWRRTVSVANVFLARFLFGSQFVDHNFVQFYRREAVASAPVLSRGVSTVTLELIVRMRRMGYRLVGMDSEYHRRESGKSTITLRKTLHAFMETVRLWWLMNRSWN